MRILMSAVVRTIGVGVVVFGGAVAGAGGRLQATQEGEAAEGGTQVVQAAAGKTLAVSATGSGERVLLDLPRPGLEGGDFELTMSGKVASGSAVGVKLKVMTDRAGKTEEFKLTDSVQPHAQRMTLRTMGNPVPIDRIRLVAELPPVEQGGATLELSDVRLSRYERGWFDAAEAEHLAGAVSLALAAIAVLAAMRCALDYHRRWTMRLMGVGLGGAGLLAGVGLAGLVTGQPGEMVAPLVIAGVVMLVMFGGLWRPVTRAYGKREQRRMVAADVG